MWCNESIGTEIRKEFYKNVHEPQLNASSGYTHIT